mmetsp:Transcript_5632/g.14265  ORF Transcript_5632/g.14265 Transcript_5632/m.14265 type:complete len:119 (-) Transcript_5632:1337-1693(-)
MIHAPAALNSFRRHMSSRVEATELEECASASAPLRDGGSAAGLGGFDAELDGEADAELDSAERDVELLAVDASLGVEWVPLLLLLLLEAGLGAATRLAAELSRRPCQSSARDSRFNVK